MNLHKRVRDPRVEIIARLFNRLWPSAPKPVYDIRIRPDGFVDFRVISDPHDGSAVTTGKWQRYTSTPADEIVRRNSL